MGSPLADPGGQSVQKIKRLRRDESRPRPSLFLRSGRAGKLVGGCGFRLALGSWPRSHVKPFAVLGHGRIPARTTP
jgi:hypothetical protein